MNHNQANETLREWRESARYWEKHGPIIRTMFMPLTDALIEEAGIVSGHAVLDVAGGPGEPSLTIAETVGPKGSVTCTDAVAEMVAAAKREGQRRGLTNVMFRQCTAESLPFGDNSFNAIVSRLGAMFFSDPLAAMSEILRVAKPKGKLSFIVWHRRELNPFVHVITDIMARHVDTPDVDPNSSGAFRFAEPGALGQIVIEAGAIDVHERLLRFHIEAPISAAEFWTLRSETSGTLREKLATLPVDEALGIAQEVQKTSREFFPNNQMRFPAQMIVVTGEKK